MQENPAESGHASNDVSVVAAQGRAVEGHRPEKISNSVRAVWTAGPGGDVKAAAESVAFERVELALRKPLSEVEERNDLSP
jgi:hypothetical protein